MGQIVMSSFKWVGIYIFKWELTPVYTCVAWYLCCIYNIIVLLCHINVLLIISHESKDTQFAFSLISDHRVAKCNFTVCMNIIVHNGTYCGYQEL